MTRKSLRSGQATVEFALLYISVLVPLTFGIIFISEMLWIWHSVVDFTRDGARYAATHCYQSDTRNVVSYMQNNVPMMIDQNQFRLGPAQILVSYYSKDPATGSLSAFSCNDECSVTCQPDAVTVSVANYQFGRLLDFLKLPPITIPPFATSAAMESVGCDPGLGACLP
jgi:Flp pilus assembly protein TadG